MKPFFDMSLLIAFGFLSLLLLLGVLLRAKIKFLQSFMVPACLTGGVIGFFILNTTGFPQVQPELYPALAGPLRRRYGQHAQPLGALRHERHARTGHAAGLPQRLPPP